MAWQFLGSLVCWVFYFCSYDFWNFPDHPWKNGLYFHSRVSSVVSGFYDFYSCRNGCCHWIVFPRYSCLPVCFAVVFYYHTVSVPAFHPYLRIVFDTVLNGGIFTGFIITRSSVKVALLDGSISPNGAVGVGEPSSLMAFHGSVPT